VKQSWDRASPYERAICEKTQELKEPPEEGFADQTDVTVAVALLVDCAAASNAIAVRVLNMLLTGHVGDQSAWTQVRLRLVNIKKGIAKYTSRPMISFSPQSVEKRLKAAFYLPIATSYPDILTVFQQTKAYESASLGMCD
jgi:hypothetical protein